MEDYLDFVVRPKKGGVVRTLSLPSTVHNFRPQISVYAPLPSTFHPHDTHSLLARSKDIVKDLDVKLVFFSFKVGNLFSIKDSVPDKLRSSVVYKLSCAGCSVRYICR